MSRSFGLVPRDVREEALGNCPNPDTRPRDDLGDDVDCDIRHVIIIVFAAVAMAVALTAGAVTTYGRDDGRYANSPLHAWFDQLASGKGLCCSFADGVSIADVDWDTDGAGGHYRVRLSGEWVDVPDAAVVTEPNRDGRAFVWPYMDAEGNTQIRCFLPGAGA
jgi:hypothetical protein